MTDREDGKRCNVWGINAKQATPTNIFLGGINLSPLPQKCGKTPRPSLQQFYSGVVLQ